MTSPTPQPGGVQLVWVASYPKSGNTWVRFLLYQYFHGKAENSIDVSRFIPDIHRPGNMQAARPTGGRLFVKTHFARGPQLPFQDRSEAAIYVIRHPRDAILSWLNYLKLNTDPAKMGVDRDAQHVRTFLTLGGAPEYAKMKFGTWEQHFTSWLDGASFPVHLVRYEDLKSRGEAELTRIIEFLKLTPDPARVAEAVRLSGFDQMRALEVREKTSGKGEVLFPGGTEKVKKGVFFMNKGQSGRSLESIAPGLDKAVEQRFAGAINRFGY